VLVADLVDNPKVAHLHGVGPLALDSVVRYANSGGVVTMDRGGRLGMPHFFKDKAEYLDFLRVQKEGSKFGFSGGRCNVFQYRA
jgi:hypothetical protein